MRTIVIGRNSKVWRALAVRADVSGAGVVAIGHADVATFALAPDDRVVVLSYSRQPAENTALLQEIASRRVARCVYVSTATTNVVPVTACYEYPRVKHEAEEAAVRLCGAQVLRIGIVYGDESELPGGASVATSLDDLASFLIEPDRFPEPPQEVRLFSVKQRRFSRAIERWCFVAYGWAVRLSGPYPCLLRPVDVVCRVLGWRWYGYVFLSNRLWISTIS